MVIAPQITLETAKKLVQDLYGLKVKSMKEINSYDDKNYRVEVESECTNPHIQRVCADGYILKVLNSMDSPKQHVGGYILNTLHVVLCVQMVTHSKYLTVWTLQDNMWVGIY